MLNKVVSLPYNSANQSQLYINNPTLLSPTILFNYKLVTFILHSECFNSLHGLQRHKYFGLCLPVPLHFLSCILCSTGTDISEPITHAVVFLVTLSFLLRIVQPSTLPKYMPPPTLLGSRTCFSWEYPMLTFPKDFLLQ